MRATLIKFLAVLFTALLSRSALAESSNAGAVQWSSYSEFADGRKFVSDGALLLDVSQLRAVKPQGKNIPEAGIKRLLESQTERSFSFSDLSQDGEGNYVAPGPVKLARKYVELLRDTKTGASLKFRAKGSNDPVVILDGSKIVGVVMPLKS